MFQRVRGTYDIAPSQTPLWQKAERALNEVVSRYGFEEIRLPIMEYANLFQRSIGDATDVVEKEMYVFADRSGDKLCLRPEGTAGIMRYALSQGICGTGQLHKLWYQGAMFRYERPQKGRARQFHQFGLEVLGQDALGLEVEMMAMMADLWQLLGIESRVALKLNSIGSLQTREHYKNALVAYLSKNQAALDSDSQRRLTHNPMRIFDSKVAQTQAIMAEAPLITDYLNDAESKRLKALYAELDRLNIAYTPMPTLVRGLDYYNDLVFEWQVIDGTNAQNALCGGGRYDGLAEMLGAKPTSALGLALGMERLILQMMEVVQAPPSVNCDVYCVCLGEEAIGEAARLRQTIFKHWPQARIWLDMSQAGLKAQMRRADKTGASFAILIGENEIHDSVVQVKMLRDQTMDQLTLSESNLIHFLLKSRYGYEKT